MKNNFWCIKKAKDNEMIRTNWYFTDEIRIMHVVDSNHNLESVVLNHVNLFVERMINSNQLRGDLNQHTFTYVIQIMHEVDSDHGLKNWSLNGNFDSFHNACFPKYFWIICMFLMDFSKTHNVWGIIENT